MVLEALNMARWSRGTNLEGLVALSDAGPQILIVSLHQPARQLRRARRLEKISRYSNNAAASSRWVRHRRRFNISTCTRAQNDSMTAWSKQSPIVPST